jgi:cyclopropane-fatty-acyl-phospholipid synthase
MALRLAMGLIDLIASSPLQHYATSAQCIRFLDELLRDYPKHDLQVRFWDGQVWGAQSPCCTLVLDHPGTLRRLCTDPSELSLGEAYIYEDVDIQGNIETVFELADHLLAFGDTGVSDRLQLLRRFRELPNQNDGPLPEHRGRTLAGPLHSKKRDSQAVRYHYDLPPEFFALFLGRSMQYSSAYFHLWDEHDLEAAQERKLDYICRKLQLRQGETLLDIGCGWGGLLTYAAGHYGVRAVGITLSISQADAARERIRDAGLNQQCRVEVCDYRDLESDQLFDKVASVGMFEHVGEKLLPDFFQMASRRLKTGGLFLNSGVSANAMEHRRGASFVDHYVFPDGDLVPISTALTAAEAAGFEVRDVENLREHYGLTLRGWVRRLEEHADQARRLTDDTTYRIWRLYMAGSAHRFLAGRLNSYHTLLLKGLPEDGLPLARHGWYRD